jgi:hypothetical protein
MTIPYERLREVLDYDPEIGKFTWACSRLGRGCVRGKAAGCVKGEGYHYITIDGYGYLAARLAFLYMTGEWPEYEIDHINLIRTDNRWKNLRAASRKQNAANVPAHKDNQCGFKGVKKCRGKWQARIMASGVNVHLGSFCSTKEAHAAYCAAAVRNFGDFARSS